MTKLSSFIKKSAFGIVTGLLVFSSAAQAQKSAGTSAGDIEGIFSEDNPGTAESSQPLEQPAPIVNEATQTKAANGVRGPDKKMRAVTDLADLEPLKDIAVIQKRYLPKTGRFEFFIAGTTILNDVFF